MPLQGKPCRDGMLNLKSNELLHPSLAEFYGDAIRILSSEFATTYPMHTKMEKELADFFGIRPVQLALTAGSDDAIKIVTEAVFVNSHCLILQEPNYENYRYYAALRGVGIFSIGFHDLSCYEHKVEQFAHAFGELPPSSVVISNPNGFSGFCFSMDERRLVVVARVGFRSRAR